MRDLKGLVGISWKKKRRILTPTGVYVLSIIILCLVMTFICAYKIYRDSHKPLILFHIDNVHANSRGSYEAS